jgi:hypothetical protein
MIAAQGGQIAMLEARAKGGDQADDPLPAPQPPWVPIKAAWATLGFSGPSGLRKAIKRHRAGARWWRYDGGRLSISIETAPCKQRCEGDS